MATTKRARGPKEHVLTRMRVTERADWPWAWDSLSDQHLTDAVAEVLVARVADYNETWVVTDTQLIPACWPVHPALAREIAVLYSSWVVVFHSPNGTSDAAMTWLERSLPGFVRRMETWLGKEPSACRGGQHPADWNDAAAKIDRAVDDSPRTAQRLLEKYAASLSRSRSQPRASESVEDMIVASLAAHDLADLGDT